MPADKRSAFQLVPGIEVRRLRRFFRAFREPCYWANFRSCSRTWRADHSFGISGIVRRGTGTYQPQQAQGSGGSLYSVDEKLRRAGKGGGIQFRNESRPWEYARWIVDRRDEVRGRSKKRWEFSRNSGTGLSGV